MVPPLWTIVLIHLQVRCIVECTILTDKNVDYRRACVSSMSQFTLGLWVYVIVSVTSNWSRLLVLLHLYGLNQWVTLCSNTIFCFLVIHCLLFHWKYMKVKQLFLFKKGNMSLKTDVPMKLWCLNITVRFCHQRMFFSSCFMWPFTAYLCSVNKPFISVLWTWLPQLKHQIKRQVLSLKISSVILLQLTVTKLNINLYEFMSNGPDLEYHWDN